MTLISMLTTHMGCGYSKLGITWGACRRGNLSWIISSSTIRGTQAKTIIVILQIATVTRGTNRIVYIMDDTGLSKRANIAEEQPKIRRSRHTSVCVRRTLQYAVSDPRLFLVIIICHVSVVCTCILIIIVILQIAIVRRGTNRSVHNGRQRFEQTS